MGFTFVVYIYFSLFFCLSNFLLAVIILSCFSLIVVFAMLLFLHIHITAVSLRLFVILRLHVVLWLVSWRLHQWTKGFRSLICLHLSYFCLLGLKLSLGLSALFSKNLTIQLRDLLGLL